ncbi:MAG: FecR domain-containing protein [Candidatus Thermoplasmatota archaeon]|nr:hypothetical protein [Euryarchaeota archaeon]MBU4032016.1 FecR domain-containing protein [Candidatus Thermoplasmatota archaeon]MBU4071794.1 FecR domain-containing protein [Candidatus Thermoplasmatota archaeon]MBU4143895.1 FecR domain-containing protein [Candidatus Thermoplasmatota archaeon]MBU4592496.1 FecR domain-containing protein [Candidatus Thermoplasmatota archaeon]
MSGNNWFIESISLSKKEIPPTEDEMDKLVPSSWPSGWKELCRVPNRCTISVTLGHLRPCPHSDVSSILSAPRSLPNQKSSKYDFLSEFTVAWIEDESMLNVDQTNNVKKSLLELEKTMKKVEEQYNGLTKEQQEEAKEMYEKQKKMAEEMVKNMAKELQKIKEIEYLGGKARVLIDEKGKPAILSILVGRFSIYDSLVVLSNIIDPGDREICTPKCDAICRNNDRIPCVCSGSTLKKEGFAHREEVQDILRSVILKIGGKKDKVASKEKKTVKVTHDNGEESVLEEDSEIRNKDTIRTGNDETVQVMDVTGATLEIGPNTEVKFNSPDLIYMEDGAILFTGDFNDTRGKKEKEAELEVTLGELSQIVENIKSEGRGIEVRSPQAVIAVRGTIFSFQTSEGTTTLTVIEGEVDFSDLKGNSVIVKTNQMCTCTDAGLGKIITIPYNLKEMMEANRKDM